MKNYCIDYKGLSLGEHRFEFKIDSELFASYEDCEVLSGDCTVHIDLKRGETMLSLSVEIQGTAEVECDRCLEPCAVEIEYQAPLLVKFTNEEVPSGEFDGEIMWLTRAETTLDLSHYLYESVLLALPYQRVHAEGECNAEMMEKFAIITSEEFEAIEAKVEQEAAEGEQKTLAQSEMSKLQALKEKMEKSE